MSESNRRGSWSWVTDVGVALLLATGYGAPLGLALGAAVSGVAVYVSPRWASVPVTMVALGVFTAWVIVGLRLYQGIRDRGRARYLGALHLLALALLPAWGLALNFTLLTAHCRTSSCDVGPVMFRVLGERGIVGLVALHVLTALAFVVSRRRPGALPAGVELLVHAALVVGLGLHVVLAAQCADLLYGLAAFPLTLPLVGPLVTIALYASELVARLRRRGP